MYDADQDTTIVMSQLAIIAFDMLADQPLEQISLDDIADAANIDRGYAAICAGTVSALILHHLSTLDNKAMRETFDDLKDAGEVSIREKILEAILHRFEVYNPYKKAVAALAKSALRHPPLALGLLAKRVAITRRLLLLCGDNPQGWQGEARIHGVVGVMVASARVWHKDDTPDLSMTMKEIDRRLEQAEEWGCSLGVFGRGASRQKSDTDDTDDTTDTADMPNDGMSTNSPNSTDSPNSPNSTDKEADHD